MAFNAARSTRSCPRLSAWVLPAALVVATFVAATHAQQFPFGTQPQSYRAGTLFPTNFARAQMNAHVTAYYDSWKSHWLKPDPGGNGWRVLLDNSGATVSEGQGYGMVIVPLMAGYDPQANTIFDGLWQFRLAHPSEIDNRLMDWNVPNTSDGNDSAFDGDADIAYGLLLAHAQWGSGGTINYLQQAKNVIAGIKARTIGPTSKLPMLGDWVSPNGSDYSQWDTRSSDFMLSHFRTWGAATNDSAYWSSVVTAVQNVTASIQANESSATGLLPDFIRLVGALHDPQPAPADFLEDANDGKYSYNAGRDPWRLGVDALLNNDPTTLAQVQKINQWIRTSTGGNANNVKEGYQLNGTPINNNQSLFFRSPFAVAAMTGTSATDQTWLNNLYASFYDKHETGDYYADAVTLQVLLTVTGNMWDPMAVLARVSGDYNRDGSINAQDYNTWKAAVGLNASESPIADGNGNGIIDTADYVVWRNNFVATAAGQSDPSLLIPEPFGTSLLAAAALSLTARLSATGHRRKAMVGGARNFTSHVW